MGNIILPRNPQRRAASSVAAVFMFPGQSSVAPDCISRARRAHPVGEEIAGRARRVLGEARAAAYLDADAVPLHTNRDVQIAVFLASQMYLSALAAEGVSATASLGLSLGEYSHIVHIGALDFDAALRLVDERGRCYDEAPQGMMATVMAVGRDVVAAIVERARAHGEIVISNINAATQHVIAGANAAVEWAAATLEDEHGAHVTVIERRVPMHSPLMAPVAAAFGPALASAAWQAPARPYFPNVDGTAIAHPAAADFVSLLTRHVSEPVLWQAALGRCLEAHPEATFIEVGPGSVLHNLLARVSRGSKRARTDAPDGIDPREHFAAVVESLHA
jgi:[acyl-carrier-protein] S-malonyltransferase